jgi:hypothetical protein
MRPYCTTCFGCPDQPSSGRGWIHKKGKGERHYFNFVSQIILIVSAAELQVVIFTVLNGHNFLDFYRILRVVRKLQYSYSSYAVVYARGEILV